MEAEEAALRGASLELLSSAPPAGQPEMELWVFGVVIGLEVRFCGWMSGWSGDTSGEEDVAAKQG